VIWPFRKNPVPPKGRPKHYPAGYSTEASGADVFDPAVQHYPHGFVKGEPTFSEPERERAYHRDRRVVFDHCLSALAASPIAEQVVLRGSATLELWFGERARRAKDIDLVVRQPGLLPDTKAAHDLLSGLRRALCSELRARGVDCRESEVSSDSIWTYERAEGRRLVFPWVWQQELRTQIQVDVVFCEPLQEAPSAHEFARGRLWFASRAESLAWKLLWLSTDMHPQGKDLYDAVLLAESAPLSAALVRAVFDAKQCPWGELLSGPRCILDWEVDWENFARDYPTLALGPAEAWKQRLVAALAFTHSEVDETSD
jgi:hypothetical protein